MHRGTFFNVFNLRCNEKSASVAVHDCKKKKKKKRDKNSYVASTENCRGRMNVSANKQTVIFFSRVISLRTHYFDIYTGWISCQI